VVISFRNHSKGVTRLDVILVSRRDFMVPGTQEPG